jgi:hypothetical protein
LDLGDNALEISGWAPPDGRYAHRLRNPRTISALGLGAVVAIDGLRLTRKRPRILAGFFDEVAHLGTGLVVLAALGQRSEAFEAGLMAGSVLLDSDHAPELIGSSFLRGNRTRPGPHSVATLLLMTALARQSSWFRGELASGSIVGVVGHLSRDLATGTNAVPLLWPLSRRRFAIRYRGYFLALSALALVAAQRPVRGGAARPSAGPTLPAAVANDGNPS